MRIGLIGWYGHQNAGDQRILECLQRFFDGHDLVVTRSLADAADRAEELDACDFVLLGGGGLILRGTGRYAGLIRNLRPRFGCVGIGVEARHRDNLQFIEAVKDRAEFILVRDERSRQLLRCPSKTVVGPDLTFLYPYDAVAEVEADVCGLNLRPWVSWHGEFAGLHDRLMHKLNARAPELVARSLFSRWEPDKAVDMVHKSFAQVVPLPLYLEPDRGNDRSVLSAYFADVPDVFLGESLDGCRFVASMRFHGLVFACQKGIPFLSFSYQPKNERFCRALGLERLSMSLFDLGALPGAIRYLKANHATLRATLLEARASHRQVISDLMADVYHQMAGTVHRSFEHRPLHPAGTGGSLDRLESPYGHKCTAPRDDGQQVLLTSTSGWGGDGRPHSLRGSGRARGRPCAGLGQ